MDDLWQYCSTKGEGVQAVRHLRIFPEYGIIKHDLSKESVTDMTRSVVKTARCILRFGSRSSIGRCYRRVLRRGHRCIFRRGGGCFFGCCGSVRINDLNVVNIENISNASLNHVTASVCRNYGRAFGNSVSVYYRNTYSLKEGYNILIYGRSAGYDSFDLSAKGISDL